MMMHVVAQVKNLLWFHAFNRANPIETLAVLQDGPSPTPPEVVSTTASNERVLGLTHSVYAYLGRSAELFGKSGFVFPQDKTPTDALLSPFDTGGLVRHTTPVNSWDNTDKGAYAKAYSWPQKGLNQLLIEYPGDRVAEYIEGKLPNFSGPHVLWDKRSHKTADIWNSGNQWPAWTWELRTAGSLPAGFGIKYWTAPPHIFEKLQQLAEIDAGPKIGWYEHLASTYVEGGVTQLINHVRSQQVVQP